jgi:hypothetical protein
MTGAAILAATALLTLGGIWVGSGATDCLLGWPRQARAMAPNTPVAVASTAAP